MGWPGRAARSGAAPSTRARLLRWAGGRDGRCSPAIAVLDANVAAAVELLAVLEPAIGGLGVAGCCLALQGLLLTHLSRLAFHLLQLGPGGCGEQGKQMTHGQKAGTGEGGEARNQPPALISNFRSTSIDRPYSETNAPRLTGYPFVPIMYRELYVSL